MRGWANDSAHANLDSRLPSDSALDAMQLLSPTLYLLVSHFHLRMLLRLHRLAVEYPALCYYGTD